MTMPDEPTLGEVVRTLARIERDLGTRLDGITARLDRVITVELYEAHQAAVGQRIATAEEEVAELKKQLERDEEKRAADAKAEQDRRAADRRMVYGALIAAALALIGTIVGTALLIALGLQGG